MESSEVNRRPCRKYIRFEGHERDLIHQATEGSVTAGDAKDALLDHALFSVDRKNFTKLQKLLTDPLPPSDKLRRLLKTKAPSEK